MKSYIGKLLDPFFIGICCNGCKLPRICIRLGWVDQHPEFFPVTQGSVTLCWAVYAGRTASQLFVKWTNTDTIRSALLYGSLNFRTLDIIRDVQSSQP